MVLTKRNTLQTQSNYTLPTVRVYEGKSYLPKCCLLDLLLCQIYNACTLLSFIKYNVETVTT